jgi:hypothetical protein
MATVHYSIDYRSRCLDWFRSKRERHPRFTYSAQDVATACELTDMERVEETLTWLTSIGLLRDDGGGWYRSRPGHVHLPVIDEL